MAGRKKQREEEEPPRRVRRVPADGNSAEEPSGGPPGAKAKGTRPPPAAAAAIGAAEGSDKEWEDYPTTSDDDGSEGGYIEPYADDADDEIVEESEDGGEEGEEEDDAEYSKFKREAEMVGDSMGMMELAEAAGGNDGGETFIWRGDQHELDPEAKLSYANKAYDTFFQLRTEYPCLSFDIIADEEGAERTRYPLTMYFVCGSQADESNKNKLYVIKVSNVLRTKHDVDSEEEDDDGDYIGDAGQDSEEEEGEELNNGEPIVEHRVIPHHGTANRVRCSPHTKRLCAVWSDAGHVQIFDLQNDFEALSDFTRWSKEEAARSFAKKPKTSALRFCTPPTAHQTEGYGLDWSPVARDVFASGDCAGTLCVWQPTEDGRWAVAGSNSSGTSIEEVKWSPTQSDVLMCGRVGGTIEVWDKRDMRRSQIAWQADKRDINVMDWNRVRQASHLLVSGSDSGVVAVWDLRRAKAAGDPLQTLTWHKGSITSVEFSVLNESVLAVTGSDGQATLWDLSLERDASEERQVTGELFERPDLTAIPDQLMFQHQGLVHPKEVHWHHQVPGLVLVTDYNGIHLFKPMNWRSLMK